MSDGAAAPGEPGSGDGAGGPVRARRDAAATRRNLVAAARRRFAEDGYRATTVRDVAADAGVNVALINRYFTSKEGLFAACLPRSLEPLDGDDPGRSTPHELVRRFLGQITGPPPGGEALRLPLLLLLRSSGDEQADRVRRDTLRAYAEHLAAVSGPPGGDAAARERVLRAEVALAALLGMVLLRTSVGLEPLVSADADDLAGPLGAVMDALLGPA